MNKKATEYGLAFLSIVFLIVLISASYQLRSKIKQYEPIGKAQYDLIKAYDNGEKALFYIDNAAKISAYETINQLSQNGGLYSEDCGYYFGARLLTNKNKSCIPEQKNAENNFKALFNNLLIGSILKYEPSLASPNYNFDLDTQGNLKIKALSAEKISIPIIITEDKKKIQDYIIPKDAEGIVRKISNEYGDIIRQESKLRQVDEKLIIGVISQETKGDPSLISFSGCAGLMQFCYCTAWSYSTLADSPSCMNQGYNKTGLEFFSKLKSCNCLNNDCHADPVPDCNTANDDRFDYVKSLKAGIYYLSTLENEFAKYTFKRQFAIAAYNGGSRVVKKAIAKTGKNNPSWNEVAQVLTPDLITYFSTLEGKEKKVNEIIHYVNTVSGYIIKYEEVMKSDANKEQVNQEEKTGEEMKQCCVCEEQCGTSCEIKIIPKKESCGFTSAGRGLSCEESFCLASKEIIGVGQYNINPSFEIDIDYDLNNYNKIYSALEKLLESFEKSNDKENFTNNIIEEAKKIDGDINWVNTCVEDQEKVFYSFAEQIYLCSVSTDSDCYCEIKIPSQIPDKSYFKIEQEGNNTIISLDDLQEKIIGKKPGMTAGLSTDPMIETEISVSKKGEKYVVELSNGNKYESTFKNPLILKKTNDRILFIRQTSYSGEYQNYLKYPNDVCEVHKDTVKICVETVNEIPVYTNNNITYTNNKIYLAYHFRDLKPPLIITNLVFKTDIIGLDKQVILTWTHNDELKDVTKFNVYNAEFDFRDMPLEQIKLDNQINMIELKISDANWFDYIDTANPSLKLKEEQGSNLLRIGFETNSVSTTPFDLFLENEKLYLYRDSTNQDVKHYVSMIKFDNTQPKYLLVTSLDKANNEEKDVSSYFSLTPKDTLAPATWPLDGFDFSVEKKESENKIEVSWSQKPTKNVDGTDFDENELARYEVYIAQDMTKQDLFSTSPRLITRDSEMTEFDMTNFSKNWCFYVVPVDESNNKQFNAQTKELMDDPAFFTPKCINS